MHPEWEHQHVETQTIHPSGPYHKRPSLPQNLEAKGPLCTLPYCKAFLDLSSTDKDLSSTDKGSWHQTL